MRSACHEEDGIWLFPLPRSDVDARRVLRAPVVPEQRGLRPIVVSDRQRGLVRVFDAKLSQEVCAAPPAPPPVHSDFTAPSFSAKLPASGDSRAQLNVCLSMLLTDGGSGGAASPHQDADAAFSSTASCEIWTGWASGHVAVYALHQGQRTHMSLAERTAPPVACEVRAMLFAHRGAVHALSASAQQRASATRSSSSSSSSGPRYVFSASYDCTILQFDTASRTVVRSLSNALRARGDFPTSMVRGMACALRGVCIRRPADAELPLSASGGSTTVTTHDIIYLSMDNRAHFLVAVGGDDEANDVALQLVTSSRACAKVVLSIGGGGGPSAHSSPSESGVPGAVAAAGAAPILCTADEDGTLFFMPLMVSCAAAAAEGSGTHQPRRQGVTDSQYLAYLANMYTGIRALGPHQQQQSQHEVNLLKGPVVDVVVTATIVTACNSTTTTTNGDAAGASTTTTHKLIAACCGKPVATLVGVSVTVASHGGILMCAATFAIALGAPSILHIAPPPMDYRGGRGSSGNDGTFYMCGADGAVSALVSVGPSGTAKNFGAGDAEAHEAPAPSQRRMRDVLDLVQRTKLMALAADAALEKQAAIAATLAEEQLVLQEQCTRLTAALELKTKELVELSSARNTIDALKSSLHSKMTLLEEDNTHLRAELAQASEHVGVLRRRLEETDGQAVAANARIDELLGQLQRKDDAIRGIAKEREATGNSLAERVGENKILGGNVMALERKLAKAEEELRACEMRRQRDQTIIDDQQLIIEEVRGKATHAQAEASTLRGKLTDAELSLQLAKAKQQTVRDLLVKQGILSDAASSNSSGHPMHPPVSLLPGDGGLRGVTPLSLVGYHYPPTDLQQTPKAS